MSYNETYCLNGKLGSDGICTHVGIESPIYGISEGIGYSLQNMFEFFYNLTPGYIVFLSVFTVVFMTMFLFWWMKNHFENALP